MIRKAKNSPKLREMIVLKGGTGIRRSVKVKMMMINMSA